MFLQHFAHFSGCGKCDCSRSSSFDCSRCSQMCTQGSNSNQPTSSSSHRICTAYLQPAPPSRRTRKLSFPCQNLYFLLKSINYSFYWYLPWKNKEYSLAEWLAFIRHVTYLFSAIRFIVFWKHSLINMIYSDATAHWLFYFGLGCSYCFILSVCSRTFINFLHGGKLTVKPCCWLK